MIKSRQHQRLVDYLQRNLSFSFILFLEFDETVDQTRSLPTSLLFILCFRISPYSLQVANGRFEDLTMFSLRFHRNYLLELDSHEIPSDY